MPLPTEAPLLLIGCRHGELLPDGQRPAALSGGTAIEPLLELLAPAERSRAVTLPPSAQSSFVMSRALLRAAAGELLGVAPAALSIARDEHGKPYFSGAAGALQFNYAHSRDWLLLALSRHGPVGVDVDSDRRNNRFAAIAQRYYQPAEVAALGALGNERLRRQRFIELWTLKEAYAKALGIGLATALPGMRFEISPSAAHAHLYATGNARSPLSVCGWQWRLGSGSVAALVQLSETVMHAATSDAPPLLEAVPAAAGFRFSPWAPATVRTLAGAAAAPCDAH